VFIQATTGELLPIFCKGLSALFPTEKAACFFLDKNPVAWKKFNTIVFFNTTNVKYRQAVFDLFPSTGQRYFVKPLPTGYTSCLYLKSWSVTGFQTSRHR